MPMSHMPITKVVLAGSRRDYPQEERKEGILYFVIHQETYQLRFSIKWPDTYRSLGFGQADLPNREWVLMHRHLTIEDLLPSNKEIMVGEEYPIDFFKPAMRDCIEIIESYLNAMQQCIEAKKARLAGDDHLPRVVPPGEAIRDPFEELMQAQKDREARALQERKKIIEDFFTLEEARNIQRFFGGEMLDSIKKLRMVMFKGKRIAAKEKLDFEESAEDDIAKFANLITALKATPAGPMRREIAKDNPALQKIAAAALQLGAQITKNSPIKGSEALLFLGCTVVSFILVAIPWVAGGVVLGKGVIGGVMGITIGGSLGVCVGGRMGFFVSSRVAHAVTNRIPSYAKQKYSARIEKEIVGRVLGS
ncbi:MAG: hypothetical protein K0S27_1048 [Gammaproteobacteria bacterium]|jgi:hypothetical protein|nr:hypothetical protein [Gammaproteobacteria bacterium]